MEVHFSWKLDAPCIVYCGCITSVCHPSFFMSLFALNAGWGDHTCGAEEFARVQTACGAEAAQKADAAGDPRRQGGGAARRLQGDDCNAPAANVKAFRMSLSRRRRVCFPWWLRSVRRAHISPASDGADGGLQGFQDRRTEQPLLKNKMKKEKSSVTSPEVVLLSSEVILPALSVILLFIVKKSGRPMQPFPRALFVGSSTRPTRTTYLFLLAGCWLVP